MAVATSCMTFAAPTQVALTHEAWSDSRESPVTHAGAAH